MNKGIIYKIVYSSEGKIKYCIRLDRTVKFDEKEEYNIYIKDDKTAKLFNCCDEIGTETKLNISHLLGKKLEFTLSFDKDDSGKEVYKITSIEETAIGEK